MTNSFFSKPEDELTVEELKAFTKSLPKLPKLPKWDSKFAPGRGESRAAFAKSKRNLDATLERDAFTVKNRGNTGTFINNPQTKKRFGTPWNSTNADKIDKVITSPTTITEEQMKIKSQEGVSRTAEIMKNDSRFDAGRAAIKKDPSLALKKEGKPNLGWSTVFDTVDADGQPQVLTRNERKAWEMKNQDLAPKPEPPSALNPIGDPVDKPLPGTGSRYNQDGSKGQLGVGWGEPANPPNIPKTNTDISQASAKAFDGTSAGTAAGMNTIAAIAGGLNKLMNKPKEKGVVIPDLHESKDVQLVAAANPWDEFANLMG